MLDASKKVRLATYLTAKESIRIESLAQPELINGDGEIVGQTPFECRFMLEKNIFTPKTDQPSCYILATHEYDTFLRSLHRSSSC